MPYKNKEDQRAASRKWYNEHKELTLQRTRAHKRRLANRKECSKCKTKMRRKDSTYCNDCWQKRASYAKGKDKAEQARKNRREKRQRKFIKWLAKKGEYPPLQWYYGEFHDWGNVLASDVVPKSKSRFWVPPPTYTTSWMHCGELFERTRYACLRRCRYYHTTIWQVDSANGMYAGQYLAECEDRRNLALRDREKRKREAEQIAELIANQKKRKERTRAWAKQYAKKRRETEQLIRMAAFGDVLISELKTT